MSFLFGAPTNASTKPQIQSFRVQNSAYGLVRPLVFGTNRIPGNLIWYGDFKATAHKQEMAGKGGASGGGSTSYTYSASFALGLCEGPISGISRVWKNKKIKDLAHFGLTLFNGHIGQNPWGHLTSKHEDKALGYSGLAYVAKADFDLGTSSELPNWNFEVSGLCISSLGLDANPADVITFLLTDANLGSGFPVARLDALSDYSQYCLAANLLISPVYSDQREAGEIIQEIADFTNSAWVQTQGKITLVPYGDEVLSANGATYTPPSQPLYDLTDDDFLDKNEPVKLSRKRPADAENQITLEFYNRDNKYNQEPVTVFDAAAVDLYGLRPSDTKQAHIFADKAVTKRAAQIMLQRQAVRNEYTFRVGWRYILLDPMDIVTLTDLALGLDRQWVRILSIEEDDNGDLTMTAEEYLNGTGAAAEYDFENPDGYFADEGSDSGNCNPPVIFEPPWLLVQGLEIWAAVSGGENWGGCDVYVSTDDETYKKIGEIDGNARQGLLTATLPAGSEIDTVNTLSVDMSESRAQLNSGTQQDARLLNTLCYCDGELLAYETATLTAENRYDLEYLVRGAYDADISAHEAGSKFVRLDSAIFKYPFDQVLIGKPLYFKLLGKNIYGQLAQDIADLEPYIYFPTGLGLTRPPANVTNLTYSLFAGMTRITWDAVADNRPIDYEIRLGPFWASAKKLYRTPVTNCPYWGDGTYWVAAHYKSPTGLEVYSDNPVSIVIAGGATQNNIIDNVNEKAGGWAGTRGDNLTVDGNGNLNLDGSVSGQSSYTGASSTALTSVKAANVLATYDFSGLSKSSDILAMSDILAVADVLGSVESDQVDVKLQINCRKADLTWAGWQDYIPGTYHGNRFQLRAQIYAKNNEVIAILSGFTWAIDLPTRIDHGSNVSIAAGGTAVNFSPAFNVLPAVHVTIVGATTGDTVILTGLSASGFTVQVKNAAGTGVARTVNWSAKGY